jgi:molybdopterin-binding protein
MRYLRGAASTGHLRKRRCIMKVGTRNRLEGEVIQIKCGTVMCLLKVRLPGGAEMESVVTRDSFDGLGIQSGDTVQLAVSALNVLLLKE